MIYPTLFDGDDIFDELEEYEEIEEIEWERRLRRLYFELKEND
jgi:hypothetical protein